MNEKKLFRSRSDVMLGGVCSGLAKYLAIDPTIVRLVFVVLLFMGGGGFWIYLVLWIIMPVETVTNKPGGIIEVPAQPVPASPKSVRNEPAVIAAKPDPIIEITPKPEKPKTKKVTPKSPNPSSAIKPQE